MHNTGITKTRQFALLLFLLMVPAGVQAQGDEEIWKAHMEAASAAIKADNPTDALFALGNALRQAEKFGPGDQRLANTLTLMAALQRSQGNFEEAEAAYLQLITVLERGQGPDSPSVANALDTLAAFHQEEHNIRQEVEGAQQQEHAEEEDQSHTPGQAAGQAHEHDVHLEAAAKLLQRSLAIREKAFGMDDASVDASVNRLAVVYDAQAHYPQVEVLLRRSLETRERVFGKQAPEVASSLYNLGVLAQKQGQLAEAESLLKRSWQIREQHFGLQDLELERSLGALASLY
ncbi:MAG: tetratricopeptide repeat protein, partial [Acidobacteria bacterium]|nr:tetratricopeptide repeat protein [Acidobacteriota bacterium]